MSSECKVCGGPEDGSWVFVKIQKRCTDNVLFTERGEGYCAHCAYGVATGAAGALQRAIMAPCRMCGKQVDVEDYKLLVMSDKSIWSRYVCGPCFARGCQMARTMLGASIEIEAEMVIDCAL